jgi:hypothetical protein
MRVLFAMLALTLAGAPALGADPMSCSQRPGPDGSMCDDCTVHAGGGGLDIVAKSETCWMVSE